MLAVVVALVVAVLAAQPVLAQLGFVRVVLSVRVVQVGQVMPGHGLSLSAVLAVRAALAWLRHVLAWGRAL